MSRLDRVSVLIRQEISTILLRKIDSKKVGFVSIIEVDVAPNLRSARVYFSQLGTNVDIRKTQRFLQQSASFIKGELGKVLSLKTVPNLTFVYDQSLERGDRVLAKMRELKNET